MTMNASFPDLAGEYRTEPVPPETHRLMADIDAALKQQIFNLPQRQRIADVHHHRKADDLGRAIEITEGILHHGMLRNAHTRLKLICSDNAPDSSARWSILTIRGFTAMMALPGSGVRYLRMLLAAEVQSK